MYLYIDIETLPGVNKPKVEDLKCPGSYKKPDSIKAWYDDPARIEELEEVYRKSALDPWEGKVFCIAWALVEEGDEAEVKVVYSETEEELFRNFQSALQENERKLTDKMSVVRFVGHNIKSFDIPYLYLRAAKYGLKWLKSIIPANQYDKRIEDTMEMVCVTARMTPDKYTSLDKACKFFGLPGKSEIDGSMVYDLYQAGEAVKIADYCKADVERVIQLHNKLR